MNRWVKAGIVLAGYALSVVAGWVASWAYDRRMAAMPYDTSGGMYAAGEAMTGLGAFLVAALVPTLLLLWFVRRNARLWQWVGALSLAFAIAGLIAAVVTMVSRGASGHPALMLTELFGLAQLLGVPLWLAGFALFALLAPTRPARRLLVTAAGVELVVAVCAAIHWFVLPGIRL